MSKYIEADAVEKAICKRVYAVEVEDILAEMANAPSIDIVRCKECKEWDKNDHECYLDRGGLYFPNADDFCSYGQKGDENVETD